MKIRHYNTANPGVRRTADVTPKPTSHFRLAVNKQSEYIFGEDMKQFLQAAKFNQMFPKWDPPRKWLWVRVDGSYEKVLNPDYQPYEDAYDIAWLDLIAWMDANLTTLEEWKEVTLPHEDGTVWELVDMTKPYHQRYTPIPVDPFKYTGEKIWQVSAHDLIMTFAEIAKYKRWPSHWLAMQSMYINPSNL